MEGVRQPVLGPGIPASLLTSTSASPGVLSLSTRSTLRSRIAELGVAGQYYLQYAREKLTNDHYSVRCFDLTALPKAIITLALYFEPLMDALLSFASYHANLQQSAIRARVFLALYDRAISGLKKLLASAEGQRQSNALPILITTLQLATIEVSLAIEASPCICPTHTSNQEYLGDQMSCRAHQRAASALLMSISPELIERSQVLRLVFLWYMRFDIASSKVSHADLIISKEWALCVFNRIGKHLLDSHKIGDVISHQDESLGARSCHCYMQAADLSGEFYRSPVRSSTWHDRWKALGLVASLLTKDIRRALNDIDASEPARPTNFEPVAERVDRASSEESNPVLKRTRYVLRLLLVDSLVLEILCDQNVLQRSLTAFSPVNAGMAQEACRVIEGLIFSQIKDVQPVLACSLPLCVSIQFLNPTKRQRLWSMKMLAILENSG